MTVVLGRRPRLHEPAPHLPFGALSARVRDKAKPETAEERAAFYRARKAEAQYARALRQVARHTGEIVKQIAPAPGDMSATMLLQAILGRYAEALRPWANVTAARMIADVSRRDESAWAQTARQMGLSLLKEIKDAPTGHLLRGMLQENVGLITSLPLEAGNRVHALTLKGLETGARFNELQREILRTGEVTANRATLIARTETARTASGLTEARARHIGSDGYIWRTVGDADVRDLHRKLNGKFFRWDDPPVAGSSGERAHAGQIYNCRCYPEPVIPDDL